MRGIPAVERALREAEEKRERRRLEEQLEASRLTLAALNNILLILFLTDQRVNKEINRNKTAYEAAGGTNQ